MKELDDTLRSLGLHGLDTAALPALVVGTQQHTGEGAQLALRCPIDGKEIASLRMATPGQVDVAVTEAAKRFSEWREKPAPARGELVRLIGIVAREHKEDLAALITLEVGKTVQEALGEVQEWIDLCDYAVGLSRQLHGLTMASERPEHRLMEQWLPIGPVGVVTAFNFPIAVWSWNTMLALVCGDPVIWKPSEKAPLCALGCHRVVQIAAERLGMDAAVSSLVIGDGSTGEALATDKRVPVVSATGSVAMGRKVGAAVGSQLGRSILELGGNNGMIIAPTADLDLALRAIVFAAVGTTGQRCTTLRRIIVHRSIADRLAEAIAKSYEGLAIGDPRDESVVVGPLIDERGWQRMEASMKSATEQGGQIVCGGTRITSGVPEGGVYVAPCLMRMPGQTAIMLEETFAPLLYMLEYDDFDEAVALLNGVPQGLSSAIFTRDMGEAERFVSASGSDCGMANVNIGTSGAEIGGAFGGEKDTGGGRESGSDAWRNYMRRTTNTINYGDELPLAQGIEFDI